MNKEEELLAKGFRLAYFIIPHRSLAIQILSDARSKLAAQRSREKKRIYWRDKHLKSKITKMAREEGDLLQWLIYFESEDHERQQEQSSPPSTEDMVVRYVKYLVQITTSMSSFYVNIGLYRLLHNYTTAEIRRTYEWMAEHCAGEEEYRAVKGALMNRVQARFGKLLSTWRAHRGELRFEVSDKQHDWQNFVEQCLRVFTPWSTSQACWVPARFGPNAWTGSELLRKILGTRDLDRIEMYRCHAFVDPCCYGRLSEGMGLDAPRNRLSIPKFFLGNETTGHQGPDKSSSFGNRQLDAGDLTESERRAITSRLAMEATQRRQVLPQVLRIKAHGQEFALWDLTRESERSLEIQDGTNLIEVWTEWQGKEILLATHLVDYSRSEGIARSKRVIDLDAKRELLLHTVPAGGGAVLHVTCRPIWRLWAWRQSLQPSLTWPGTFSKYALASACLLVIGWVIGAVWRGSELARQRGVLERVSRELTAEKAARATLEHRLNNGPGAETAASLWLLPITTPIRGQQPAPTEIVTIAQNTSLITLELPVGEDRRPTYAVALKPFLERREILKENFLKAKLTPRGSAITVPLPASLLENNKRYVVTLYGMSATGESERVDMFTFYVIKK